MQGIRILSVLCFSFLIAFAVDTGTVRGIVHDPQHRPVTGAQVVLHDASFSKTVPSDANGEFQIDGVPEGAYTIDASASGFGPLTQKLTVTATKTPVLHLQLELASISSRVEISGTVSRLNTPTSTVQTSVTSEQILQTPGADQTNSLAMITDFTPGAYMVHDMLHMRGGHQVNWFFDGIPVINTNIAANVAPLINPKNVEELEIERGGYSSEYGDRTYGFFNVVTPSGFERDNEAESDSLRWEFLFHRRSVQRRRPYAALRLLCERRRQPLRTGPRRRRFRRSFTIRPAAWADFFRCFSIRAQRISSAGSLRCAKIIIRSPTTPDAAGRRHSRSRSRTGLPRSAFTGRTVLRRRTLHALALLPLTTTLTISVDPGHALHSG